MFARDVRLMTRCEPAESAPPFPTSVRWNDDLLKHGNFIQDFLNDHQAVKSYGWTKIR